MVACRKHASSHRFGELAREPGVGGGGQIQHLEKKASDPLSHEAERGALVVANLSGSFGGGENGCPGEGGAAGIGSGEGVDGERSLAAMRRAMYVSASGLIILCVTLGVSLIGSCTISTYDDFTTNTCIPIPLHICKWSLIILCGPVL